MTDEGKKMAGWKKIAIVFLAIALIVGIVFLVKKSKKKSLIKQISDISSNTANSDALNAVVLVQVGFTDPASINTAMQSKSISDLKKILAALQAVK